MRRNKNLSMALAIGILFSLFILVSGQCVAEAGGMRYSIVVSKFQNLSNWRGQWSLGDAWGQS